MKACCMYEKLTGKSFLKCVNEEETVYAMYCGYVVNNNINITFNAFLNLMEDEKVANWFVNEYTRMGKFMEQFREEVQSQSGDNKEVEEEDMTITNATTALIFNYGLDPHYVMYEMDLWELPMMLNAAHSQYKLDMEEKRMWAFINVMPHIDHKKCKSAEKLLPFPWDKDNKENIKKKKEKELKNNEYAMKHTIGMTLNI